jgi:hypothetical protein
MFIKNEKITKEIEYFKESVVKIDDLKLKFKFLEKFE